MSTDLTAIPAARLRSWTSPGFSSGLSRKEKSRFFEEGAIHERPLRPLPSVCSSATATMPSGAFCWASFFMACWVEVILGKYIDLLNTGLSLIKKSIRVELIESVSLMFFNIYPFWGIDSISIPSLRIPQTSLKSACLEKPSFFIRTEPGINSPSDSARYAKTLDRLEDSSILQSNISPLNQLCSL